MPPVISWDCETHMFAAGRIAPPMVCSSWAEVVDPAGPPSPDGGSLDVTLSSTGDQDLDARLRVMIEQAARGELLIVGHNVAYDLSILVTRLPDTMPLVFQALELGMVHDTMIREKLLDLAIDGDLEFLRLPDGSAKARDYSLAGLENIYLGIDRSKEKVDSDAWRSNYAMLDGMPSAAWPARASDYAKQDAEGTLLVWMAQNQRALGAGLVDHEGEPEIPTQDFQVASAFSLRLIECWGIAIDADKKAEIEAQLREELKPERMRNLLNENILLPGKGAKVHVEGCPKGRCACPKKDKTSRKTLIALVEHICTVNGLKIKKKAPTEKMEEEGIEEGNTSVDKNVLQEIAHLHPALEEYQYRQYLSKLVNTELPRMSGPIIYPRYNVLVATGRTSSFAADTYPSANIQNVSAVKKLRDEHGNETGEINVRECYVPRGIATLRRHYRLANAHLIVTHPEARKKVKRVLCSIDFAALEFCAMGQVCYELFGYSVMRDLINEGKDPHAYLGAQIALEQHDEFREVCADFAHDAMAVYDAFKACEHHADEELRKFYKQYRKLAKPVGFGFPGGLGIEKFVGFAAAHPYYVRVTEDQARALKAVWFKAYPEMADYFAWVNSQKQPGDYYAYETPAFGMRRAGCTYTSMCNGRLLQSPAAEGAKLSVWEVVRACYDVTQRSILLGQRVLAFVHDELLLELSGTRQEIHDAAHEAARLMVVAMSAVLPDVKITAKPALQLCWNKEAETVYDENGILDIWTPAPKTHKKAA